MERFVRLLVAGGIGLVAGLWVAHSVAWWSPPWLVGVGLAAAGAAGLAAGIGSAVER